MEQKMNKHHEVVLVDRKTLEISGVVDLESFDNEEFLVHTVTGLMLVSGNEMKVTQLNLEQGLLAITGNINEIRYMEKGAKDGAKGFFGKLFK